MSKKVWELQDALRLLPQIELILKPHGWHCALGGSVLHRGWSEKDLDIFVYPHDTRKVNVVGAVWTVLLQSLDHDDWGSCSASGGKQDRDDKVVKWMKSGNRRIDFFFVK